MSSSRTSEVSKGSSGLNGIRTEKKRATCCGDERTTTKQKSCHSGSSLCVRVLTRIIIIVACASSFTSPYLQPRRIIIVCRTSITTEKWLDMTCILNCWTWILNCWQIFPPKICHLSNCWKLANFTARHFYVPLYPGFPEPALLCHRHRYTCSKMRSLNFIYICKTIIIKRCLMFL